MSRSIARIEKKKKKVEIRVAAYCRVSTDTDAQINSLENQMEAFRYRLSHHKDWKLVKIYADKGLSGTSIKGRARFMEMLEDCRMGKIDCILTKSISRFARNTVDTLTTVKELQRYGVNVIFEKEGIDTSDSFSEMILTIMASFAQEESRSISENVKWGIRKRFEEGRERRVPLYGFCHTEKESFQIVPQEAQIVREIFERYAHGELPLSIMKDMIARKVKPPSGSCWKRAQIDRMLHNEKYAGDCILQKNYSESYLTHKLIRNTKNELPKYYMKDAHTAIVDRHTYEQALKVFAMRRIEDGNSTYPYGTMLRCPRCGNPLIHGSLSNFSYNGERIRNGGWGCYGKGGCGKYLLIQNVLDAAVLEAFAKKYGEKKEKVDFYWLDDTVEDIDLKMDRVTIRWQDGEATSVNMEFSDERFVPENYADFYNGFLGRIARGSKKNKYKNLMGIGTNLEPGTTLKRIRSRHAGHKNSCKAEKHEAEGRGILPCQHQSEMSGGQPGNAEGGLSCEDWVEP